LTTPLSCLQAASLAASASRCRKRGKEGSDEIDHTSDAHLLLLQEHGAQWLRMCKWKKQQYTVMLLPADISCTSYTDRNQHALKKMKLTLTLTKAPS